MIVEETLVTLRCLKPANSENWLCKKIEESYSFSKMVYLAIGDSEENWSEITDEKKQQLEEEIQNGIDN